MKTNLTSEQSQRLIELGVDPSKASMMRLDFNGTYAYVSGEEADTVRACVNAENYVEECEIFTLSDILSLVPKEIDGQILSCLAIGLDTESGKTTEGWSATYVNENMDASFGTESIFSASELIYALFKLLVWVLKNHPDKIKRL